MDNLPLLTPAKVMLCASMETALNGLLNDHNAHQLKPLRGQTLQLTLRELQLTITLVFSQQIDVLGRYEGQPDCHLSVAISALPALQKQSNITQLIKQDKLDLDGDIQVAQRFSALLAALKPDWEEWLSGYTGDVAAHLVVSGGKRHLSNIKSWLKVRERDVAEVLTEEWRIAPGPLEIAHFCDQVDEINSAAAHAEARLAALFERVEKQG